MNLFKVLNTPELAELYLAAFCAALPIVIICGVFSVLVVVKRLGFIGQGVSHSAFGGVGVVALLLGTGVISADGPAAAVIQLGIIAGFCTLAACAMGLFSDRRSLPLDTAIGVLLVGSMSLGAILVQAGRNAAEARGKPGLVQSWESILFGSIMSAGWSDAALAALLCLALLAVAWYIRRPLLFWAVDEESARAFGVATLRIKLTFLVLLALAIVVAMKLTGVILATALLALPGAIGLRVCRAWWPAVGVSVASSCVALVAGLALSIQSDWPAGPSIVAVLIALFLAAIIADKARRIVTSHTYS